MKRQLLLCVQTLAVAAIGALLVPAQPARAGTLSTTRTTVFTYNSDGVPKVLTATQEPGDPSLCASVTYGYDGYGNLSSATKQNCTNAPAGAVFQKRVDSTSFDAVTSETIKVNGNDQLVAVPGGMFPSKVSSSDGASSNPQTLAEGRKYDPRFGTPLSQTSPNSLTTNWVTDDFGRIVKRIAADKTSVVSYYCILTPGLGSSNSAACANLAKATNEVPANAVMMIHREPHDTADTKMGAYEREYYDRLGRVIRVATEAYDGSSQPAATGKVVVRDTAYNDQGMAIFKSQPYFLLSGSSTTSGSLDAGGVKTDYDALGRPTTVYVADKNGSAAGIVFPVIGSRTAAATTYTYSGLSTTVKNDIGQTTTTERNGLGQVVRIKDNTGAQTARLYDAFGNLLKTVDALQNTVAITYDTRGHKLSLSDPDLGVIGYCYDASGQVRAQQNSKMRGSNTLGSCPAAAGGASTTAAALSGWTTFAYDYLGRTTQRQEAEYVTTWSYDTCSTGNGKLCEVKTSNGLDKTYAYDSFGRPSSSKTVTGGGPVWAMSVDYDPVTGRVADQVWPTGLKVLYSYTPSTGFPQQMKLSTAVTVGSTAVANSLWTESAVNAWGLSESAGLGNGVTVRAAFDPTTARETAASAGPSTSKNVLDLSFSWDSVGRMKGRADNNGDGSTGAVSESFGYDAVNRLNSYQVSAPQIPGLARNVTLQYNAIGDMLYKSDVGDYTYPASGSALPHAVSNVNGTRYSYDANGNLTAASNGKYSGLSYSTFNQPLTASGAGTSYSWLYDESHQRVQEAHTTPQGTRTTWYAHPDAQGGLGFEYVKETDATYSSRHYASFGGQTVVLVTPGALTGTGNAPTAANAMSAVKVEYWHSDVLGSLAATTDHNGSVTARYAFDPFGKRRYTNGRYDDFGNLIVDWSDTPTAGTGRGFTGHEQLDDIGIENMNGRIYDPQIGRFMQADPMVSSPVDLQTYNRYSYCANNPLNCTDPSGFDLQSIDLGGPTFSQGQIDQALNNVNWGINGYQTIDIVGHRDIDLNVFFTNQRFSSLEIQLLNQTPPNVAVNWAAAVNQAIGSKTTNFAVAGTGAVAVAPGRGAAATYAARGAVAGAAERRAGTSLARLLIGDIPWVGPAIVIGSVAWELWPDSQPGSEGGALSTNASSANPPATAAGAPSSGRREAADRLDEAWTQLDGLLQKASKTGGRTEAQYALVATKPGLYPDVRYGAVWMDAGEVWKYGTTVDPNGRYAQSTLNALSLQMVVQTWGTPYQVLAQEKLMLIGYVQQFGDLPPGNKIFK